MENYFSIGKLGVCFALLCLIFISCEKDGIEKETENTLIEVDNFFQENFTIEKAYPNTEGEWIEIQLYGQSAMVEKIGEDYILGGDMIVIPDEDVTHEGAKSTGRTLGRWPNNIVYYTIENNLPDKERVADAMSHWESKTSIRFLPRTDQSAYVNFRSGSGCSSNVGRIGRKQNITLANACTTGNTIHEIGHALGLWHEQSRKDRDEYIKIKFQNIESGKDHNFKTYVARGYDGNEYSNKLDFGSIMMYSSYAFSKNNKPTIVKKNGNTYKTQRNALSDKDKNGIAQMYPGTAPIKIINLKGDNGKYVSLKNKNKKNRMKCNKSSVGASEKFQLINLSNGKIALKGNNGHYVSSENGKKITCSRKLIGSWEQFTLVSKGGNKYALKGSNGKYVSSEKESEFMTCNRASIGSWEIFTISGL